MLRIRSAVALWLTTSLVIILLPSLVWGQQSESADWAADIANRYRTVPNITYLTANNYEAKLDLYLPRNLTEPNATLVYIHGGGWVRGSKELSTLRLLPYLEMGWSVRCDSGWRCRQPSRPIPTVVPKLATVRE